MRRRWQSTIVTTIIIATMSAITIITATTTM
ncbi:hypothetical protein EOA22_21930 [Mesorhizobium sp. M7A.F.Ca.US.014.04.1.1]|nr:hypothetical protein EOC84_11475 [Mesorhizobium sp. Primo-B]RUU39007.1 hypothetical protein EOC83_10710 [Mesorhizobium sp. Primo-A]RUX16131.1 hypothetical protein EN996_10275 [Mesorhizobium sp. M7A.F.Ca.CA.002.14.1.2]RUX35710.1 hypothetical protein EN987_27980 [Mesorhizobium sp. M7A.F.Ca.CA.002.11.2.1]RUX53383.1 hypothetical protein EN994_14085 [Mesorhizobium sp. M7A.F.Ca.CA.002.09.1.1]RUX61464.1 hypothetical protein EOA22_21930 [Mesorhizobium sp. M7A.F.Ca.US.014.04.1.1]RUX62422.1 hypothet